SASAPLPLHEIDLGEVDRVAVAVDEQDDGQADTDLGGGDGNDEEGEDLTGGVVVERAERHQVHVDRIEDELDGHQHQHAVLASQDAVYAGTEVERAKEEELVEQHQSPR